MERVVGLGAGGHAKVVIDILRLMGLEPAALLDSKASLWGATILGVPVIGGDDLLPSLRSEGITRAFVGVGGAGDTGPRRRLYLLLCELGFDVVSAVHPAAVVSRAASIGRGATLMAGSIVNAGATLGDNVIVNSGAIVEHDCAIADHVHIATGARLAGTVWVGECSHIGLGASVRESKHIGQNVIVGAGAAVVADVPDNVVVVGVPARVMSPRIRHE